MGNDKQVDLVNTKMTIEVARIKAQNYANFTGEKHLIYRYKDGVSDFGGHHLVEPVSMKSVWDKDENLEYVEEVSPK